MPNLGKLMDSMLKHWTRSLMHPYGSGEFSAQVDAQTDCNKFVNCVAQDLGYTKFIGLKANEIVDVLRMSGDWLEVPGKTAQYHANAGSFVVAGWKNPDLSKSGHVCIVIPGQCVTSGKWKITDPSVPKVANVGIPAGCRIDRGANYAFGQDQPRYYVLKSDFS